MDKSHAKERIEKLRDKIKHLNYEYFVLDKSEVSEAVRDSLKKKLKELETSFPEFVTPDSPTQRVGSALSGRFKKVRHKTPKKSLEDVFSEEEFLDWVERISKLVPGQKIDFVCELKIDGLNITLHYEKGKFVRGLTRGNGIEGEDVTHTIRAIESVPLELNDAVDLEVSGEVFMPLPSLLRLNKEQKKLGEELFSNPRNAAAGAVRQLDPAITASRQLSAFFYELGVNNFTPAPETQSDALKNLQQLGLRVNQEFTVCHSPDEVIKFWKHWQAVTRGDGRKKPLAYEIDGIVVKVNRKDFQEKMGFTAKTPRFAVAFKFAAEQATTKILDVIVQVGRTGALTPVAVLEPVFVSGSTVSRATLHNEDEIARKDIRIGDTVILQKAGDVIPEIVSVLKDLRTGREKKFNFPEKCPSCGGRVEKPQGEAIARCMNPECFAKEYESIVHFAGKKGFDIDGMGVAVVDALIENELIADAADIFSLTADDFRELPLFKDKRAENLVSAIEKSKRVLLSRFIFAIGIRHVGEGTSIDLERFVLSHLGKTLRHPERSEGSHRIFSPADVFDVLHAVSFEELNDIEGFGDIVAKSVHEFFRSQRAKHLFEKFEKAGISIFSDVSAAKTALAGKKIVITGTLKSFGREEAKDAAKRAGGIPQSDVSAKTDFLVCGEEAGGKLKRAKELGVKVIGEEEFITLLRTSP